MSYFNYTNPDFDQIFRRASMQYSQYYDKDSIHVDETYLKCYLLHQKRTFTKNNLKKDLDIHKKIIAVMFLINLEIAEEI